MTIITWLRILRERKGYKQGEFAEVVGIPKTRYQKLERMLAPIRINEVVSIAKTLQVDPSRFVKLPRSKRYPSSEMYRMRKEEKEITK
jgi:transcriptional regulator with XRE-family HTH domain